MTRPGGISGLAVAIAATGGLLVISGIRDAPILDALRDLMQGRTPTGREPVVTDAPGVIGKAAGGGAAGKEAGSAKAAGRKLARPIAGEITSGFGMRNGKMHRGVDIPAPKGTPIGAADEGTVTDTGYEPLGAGNFVKIRHTANLSTKYFHLSGFAVGRGAKVTTGQTIGTVGETGNATGPHLHFEVWYDGQAVDPAGWM